MTLSLLDRNNLESTSAFRDRVIVAIRAHVAGVIKDIPNPETLTDLSTLNAGQLLAVKYRLQVHNKQSPFFSASISMLASIANELWPDTTFEALRESLEAGTADAAIEGAIARYYPVLAAISAAEGS